MDVIDCRVRARREPLYWCYHLRDYRALCGYSRRRLAQLAGVSCVTIGRLERESQPARVPTVGKLAEALGIERRWLIAVPAPL